MYIKTLLKLWVLHNVKYIEMILKYNGKMCLEKCGVIQVNLQELVNRMEVGNEENFETEIN